MKNLIKSLYIMALLLVAVSPMASFAYGGGGGGGGGFFISGPMFQRGIGDATNDNRADVNDFNAILAAWGQTGNNLPADFNGDGTVDILDLNFLMVKWNG